MKSKILNINSIIVFIFIFIFSLSSAPLATNAWYELTPLSTSSNPVGISFVNSMEGYIASDVLYRTLDGGATWDQHLISGVTSILGVSCAGGNIYTIGTHIGGTSANDVSVSIDKGVTFTLLTREAFQNDPDIWFADLNHGVISGFAGLGSVFQTSNGGTLWSIGTVEASPDVNTTRVRGSSSSNIWATYSGGIIKWDGLSWEAKAITGSNVLNGVFVLDANTGWVVGADNGGANNVYKTINGGNSWTTVPISENPTLNDVWFINSNEGWMAGAGLVNESIIYHTTDGGAIWTKEFTSEATNDILSIFFVDGNNGFAVTSSGHVFKYTTATTTTTTTTTTTNTTTTTTTGTTTTTVPVSSVQRVAPHYASGAPHWDPEKEGDLTVDIPSSVTTAAITNLVSITGKTVYRRNIALTVGNNKAIISKTPDFGSGYPNGILKVFVVDSTGKKIAKGFIGVYR